MLTDYFQSIETERRMRASCVGPYLDDLARTMAQAGFEALTIIEHLRTAGAVRPVGGGPPPSISQAGMRASFRVFGGISCGATSPSEVVSWGTLCGYSRFSAVEAWSRLRPWRPRQSWTRLLPGCCGIAASHRIRFVAIGRSASFSLRSVRIRRPTMLLVSEPSSSSNSVAAVEARPERR